MRKPNLFTSKHFVASLFVAAAFFFVSGASPQQPAPKILTWGDQSSGDCEMTFGRLTFRPDGTGLWETNTLTHHTHSGDVWHVDINVTSAGGSQLFHLGQWNSPRMSDGGPQYAWSVPFSFDSSVWNDIYTATMNSSC